MLLIIFLISIFSLFFAVYLFFQIKNKDEGDEKMKEISQAIRQGAMAFLKKEYQVFLIFVLIVFFPLLFFLNYKIALCFLLGAFFSALAGNIGMRIATLANVRTAQAVKTDLRKGLDIAFSSGIVMGLFVVGFGVLGITIFYYLFRDPNIIYGFGFGASSVAISARVGGGIYTKAADIGADLVGKIEAGIPEDDPRNPGVIADNVGDNVGDIAGMGADLFESYVDSIIAAMAIGVLFISQFGSYSVILPLLLSAAGILASIFGFLLTKIYKAKKPSAVLNFSIFFASALAVIFTYFICFWFAKSGFNLFLAAISGLIAGILIGLITQYFTSADFSPTKKLAQSSQTGAATNIIFGLALGMKSILMPVLIICAAIFLAYKFAGIYGIALSAVGMLSTLVITLATDCYGPVADNAAGISQMANLGKETRERAENLDALGNTTAAIGKGFAIGSAALTALVLLFAYFSVAKLKILDLSEPIVIIGIFLGGLLPFLFSSMALSAVGKTAKTVISEVRRQFKEKKLLEGKEKPDYAKCVEIVTSNALSQMILPSLLAILCPVLVGFLLGKQALGGLLIGSITTGLFLALMMANSGAAWDNAKKYIEAGNFNGKGSESHKSAVIGDTVGDPFKDTAGPSLNILIKLVSIIAILIAPLLV